MYMTPGMKSSEFLLTVVALVAATVLVLTTKLSDKQWLDFAKVVVTGYGVSRGLAKITTGSSDGA